MSDDPTPTPAELASRVAALEARLATLTSPPSDDAIGPPWPRRTRPALGEVHRAPTIGFLSIYFVGGRTGTVELLVGDTPQPRTRIGYLNSGADIGSYIGAVIRAGEYWIAATKRPDKIAVECVFTPLI